MKRREFIGLSLAAAFGFKTLAQGAAKPATGAAKAITEKDIFREGMAGTIANYCENPKKQPNKFCPQWKDKPGECGSCMFFNKDNSKTTFKGQTYARCQLLADPAKPQFVNINAYCSTYVKQA
jgi:hypothetical protein